MISLDAQLKTVMTNLRWYPRGRCRRCVAGVDRPQASIGRGLSDVHNLLAMSPHGVAVVPANSARASFSGALTTTNLCAAPTSHTGAALPLCTSTLCRWLPLNDENAPGERLPTSPGASEGAGLELERRSSRCLNATRVRLSLKNYAARRRASATAFSTFCCSKAICESAGSARWSRPDRPSAINVSTDRHEDGWG